jgi:signal peptide peptidase-like protein 2B
MVSRGGCSFVVKAQRLQAAGAIAMVCVNNDEDKPDEVIPMGGDGAENITIPVVMVSFNTGAKIKALAAMTVSIKKSLSLTDALKNHK